MSPQIEQICFQCFKMSFPRWIFIKQYFKRSYGFFLFHLIFAIFKFGNWKRNTVCFTRFFKKNEYLAFLTFTIKKLIFLCSQGSHTIKLFFMYIYNIYIYIYIYHMYIHTLYIYIYHIYLSIYLSIYLCLYLSLSIYIHKYQKSLINKLHCRRSSRLVDSHMIFLQGNLQKFNINYKDWKYNHKSLNSTTLSH